MWEEILEALGFRVKATIRKFRRRCELKVSDHQVEVCLDSLPDLKDGNFVELEMIASESDLEEKQELIINLSEQLGLSESIQTSYLGILTQAGQVKQL
jgi:predicted adenylyl cyclase CyaB